MTFKKCSIREYSFGKLAIKSENLEFCYKKGLQIFINLFNRGDKMSMYESLFYLWRLILYVGIQLMVLKCQWLTLQGRYSLGDDNSKLFFSWLIGQ